MLCVTIEFITIPGNCSEGPGEGEMEPVTPPTPEPPIGSAADGEADINTAPEVA